MTRWALFYANGSVFTSEDGRPQDSPAWGVVAIAQITDAGSEVRGGRYDDVLASGVPWYVWRDDEQYWQELDNGGFLDHIAHYAHVISAVRFGRYIGRDVFQERWAAARKWVTAHG
jgi:hypothetical protein